MDETDNKSKELAIIKGQMVNVISNLKAKHHLDEIMPLLNLLKTLENYINTLHTKDCRNWNGFNIYDMKLKHGPETIGITHKISFLFNRIHIESAYLASINKSVAYGIKKYYKRKDINQFVQEKTYAIEKKKLFILSLRLILRDNTLINTTGLNLNFITSMLLENIDSGIGSLMRTINRQCTVCAAKASPPSQQPPPPHDQDDQFCFCKLISATSDGALSAQRYTGTLRFRLHAFMGLYEADYLDRMLKHDAPRLRTDQFSGGSRHKRRCVVIVRDRFLCSGWTHSAVALSGEIAVHKAKEIEIQVWEAAAAAAAVGVGRQGGHDRIVAVAIVSLQSLLQHQHQLRQAHSGTGSAEDVTISLEPDGFVMCNVDLVSALDGDTGASAVAAAAIAGPIGDGKQAPVQPAASGVHKKFAVKRRENIFTKLGGYRLARHIEANVPVSVWTDWFQNHIDRLAIPIDIEDKKMTDDKENKALGLNKHKVLITPCKSGPTNTAIAAAHGILTGTGHRKTTVSSDSYRPVSHSPVPVPITGGDRHNTLLATPKFHRTNPRAICKFILHDSHHAPPQHQLSALPLVEPLQSVRLSPHMSPPFSPTGNLHSAVAMSTPLRSRMQPSMFASTPRRHDMPSPLAAIPTRTNIKYINDNKSGPLHQRMLGFADAATTGPSTEMGMNLLMDSSITRSNIELANEPIVEAPLSRQSLAKRAESLTSRYESDDSDQGEFRDANILSRRSVMLTSPFNLHESRDLIPYACSPDLRNIPVCRLISDQNASQGHRQRQQPSDLSVTDCSTTSTSDNGQPTQSGHHQWASIDDDNNCSAASGTESANQSLAILNGDAAPPAAAATHGPMEFRDFELLCVLGQGHFGKVLLARHSPGGKRGGGRLCALKSIQKSRACTEAEYDSLLAERRILMMISDSRHPFLVGLIGCFQTERYLLFAMEYASGGDLMGHIHKEPFPESVAAFYAACIVLAFEFLHGRDVIYRDLKLDNVLMDGRGFAKLTDFGLSKENMRWDDVTTTFCGTPEFLAPEIISLQEYTRAIDWWALGVLVYEMIVGESPFPGDEDDEIFSNILHTSPDEKDLSADALSLVMRLLQQNPHKRLGYGEHGADRVKAHPFFRHIDWDRLYGRSVECPFVPQLDDLADTKYFESEFTSRPLTIEHDDMEDETVDADINDDLFLDFDTVPRPSSELW